jgi:hypothetical protein
MAEVSESMSELRQREQDLTLVLQHGGPPAGALGSGMSRPARTYGKDMAHGKEHDEGTRASSRQGGKGKYGAQQDAAQDLAEKMRAAEELNARLEERLKQAETLLGDEQKTKQEQDELAEDQEQTARLPRDVQHMSPAAAAAQEAYIPSNSQQQAWSHTNTRHPERRQLHVQHSQAPTQMANSQQHPYMYEQPPPVTQAYAREPPSWQSRHPYGTTQLYELQGPQQWAAAQYPATQPPQQQAAQQKAYRSLHGSHPYEVQRPYSAPPQQLIPGSPEFYSHAAPTRPVASRVDDAWQVADDQAGNGDVFKARQEPYRRGERWQGTYSADDLDDALTRTLEAAVPLHANEPAYHWTGGRRLGGMVDEPRRSRGMVSGEANWLQGVLGGGATAIDESKHQRSAVKRRSDTKEHVSSRPKGVREFEEMLAEVGLSGYEKLLVRNGWDTPSRLRLITENDLVRD